MSYHDETEKIHQHDAKFRQQVIEILFPTEAKAIAEAAEILSKAGLKCDPYIGSSCGLGAIMQDLGNNRVKAVGPKDRHIITAWFTLEKEEEGIRSKLGFERKKHLTAAQNKEYVRLKAEKEEMLRVLRIKEEEKRRVAAEKLRKAEEETKPLTLKQLIDFVGDDKKAQECEDHYVHTGPDKHTQEDHYNNGVSVIQMNFDLLEGWLQEDTAAHKGWELLDTKEQREVWEASHFHFGMHGYTEEDANYFWREEK
jgi:hypothetical protein